MKGYLINQPLRTESSPLKARNRTYPPLVYMSGAQVPGVRYNVEFGEIIRDHDEVILNIGGDCNEPEDLGADIEYSLGGQVLKTSTTGAIFVPRGVRHGPLTYRKFRKPHVRISILLGTGERVEAKIPSTKSQPSTNFEKYLVKKPAYEVIAGTPVKNRQGPSSMTMMSNGLVPGCDIYVEGGWVWGMPKPNPHIFEHVHDYEEIVVHFGTDYKHPEELGAEIDFYVGGEPLRLDRTSAVYVPRGVGHGPLVWKKYQSPHFEMAIMPGAGTLDEADPGGHREKMKKEGR
jgi:hypothetical protein